MLFCPIYLQYLIVTITSIRISRSTINVCDLKITFYIIILCVILHSSDLRNMSVYLHDDVPISLQHKGNTFCTVLSCFVYYYLCSSALSALRIVATRAHCKVSEGIRVIPFSTFWLSYVFLLLFFFLFLFFCFVSTRRQLRPTTFQKSPSSNCTPVRAENQNKSSSHQYNQKWQQKKLSIPCFTIKEIV